MQQTIRQAIAIRPKRFKKRLHAMAIEFKNAVNAVDVNAVNPYASHHYRDNR
jgi:hypothetical protein